VAREYQRPGFARVNAIAEDHQAKSALTAWVSLAGDTYSLTAMARVTNSLWRVDVAGTPALVLKQLPEYPVGVTPVVEFRVLSHLQRRGVPVAQPILTDAGTLLATVEDRHWALLPFLAHQPSIHELGPDAAETAFAVGAAIGHLDQALADYPWPVESFVDDPAKVLSDALSQLPHEAIRLVVPLADQLAETCTGLPVQLTHGDCNDGNVLLDGSRVAGIIDIDHLPTGPRVRDLAYYLASRLSRHLTASPTAAATTAAMVSHFSRYVAGYHDAYPLTQHERSAIVPLMLLVELGGAHWSLHGWEPDLTSYRRCLAAIAWLVERYDSLSRATTLR
jgi:Ser/Thr protein kinase RdoA (MazF antagonist)